MNSQKSAPAPYRYRLYLVLALADGIALTLSFALGMLIRFRGSFDTSGPELLAVVAPFYFILALGSEAYSVKALRQPYHGAARAVRSFIMAVAAALALFFYARIETEFSRLTLGVSFMIALVVLPLIRSVVVLRIQERMAERIETVALVRDGFAVEPPPHTYLVDTEAEEIDPSLNDPSMQNRIGHLLRNVDRVVIACPREHRRAWTDALRGLGRQIEVVAPELDELGALGFRRFGPYPTVLVAVGPLALHDRVYKRAFDLAMSVTLLVLLSPVFLAIAIAIKLDSSGPVLFRQPRIGRGNRIFTVYKFRTMATGHSDAHGSKLTSRDDPRVTLVGAFLRRTSLDELPQLLNVVLGDMSLVGPRPHALGALAGEKLYWEVDQAYWARHSVTPGITGLAQIRGHRGTTFVPEDLQNRLLSDLEYISDWSLWRDVRILFATVIVLGHKNAF